MQRSLTFKTRGPTKQTVYFRYVDSRGHAQSESFTLVGGDDLQLSLTPDL